jgi:hypothetical protein
MHETARSPGEAGRQRHDSAALGRAGLALQRRADDVLDAADGEQLEAEGPRTGGIDAGGAVALGQPEQFLGLAQARPGEGATQEHLDELADGGPDLLGLADAGVGRAHGVGGALRGVVGVVSGPPAGGLERMDLDEFPAVIDPDEAGIAADLDPLAG